MSEWGDAVLEQAREALAPVEGELRLEGLGAPVEVIRDRWGVPHIYAQSLEDLWFAQGFVQTSERLFQIDFFTRLASGRLSENFSEMTLGLDRFFRSVGLNRAAERIVAEYDDTSREMLEPFVRGMHAWIDRMPAKPIEYQVLDLELDFPRGDDALRVGAAAGALMAWILSTNWDAELLRVEIAEKLGFEAMLELFPDVDDNPAIVIAGKEAGELGRRSALDILKTAPLTPKGQGSNNWVVAGSRTESGKPLLANDPHLAVQMPAIWIECHLSAPGYEASGVALPFAPGIVIGHTAHHAWGFTNVGGDVQDLYLERLNEDRSAALYDGSWEPVTVHREEIRVRGNDEPEVLEVLETRHGPILDSYMVGVNPPVVVHGGVHETYALRWVGHEATIRPSTLLAVAQAEDFAAFREAVRDWACPGQNMVYGDVDGHIGYQATGWHPVRKRGDGTIPVPGWSSEYEWDGWVPFEEMPWALDPDSGFLCTANQKIHDDSYPWLIGKDFLPPFRARRIAEMITATEKHSKVTFARMHVDTASIPARSIVPRLLEVEPADDRQKEALAELASWDLRVDADSAAAAIYEVWCVQIAREVLEERLGSELFTHFYGRRQWTNAFQYQVLPSLLRWPSATWWGGEGVAARDEVLRRALGATLDELGAALGEDMTEWRWGSLHKARYVGQLAMTPDLAEVFTVGEVDLGGDEQTVLQGQFEPGWSYDAVVVPSWRQIVDLGDIDASVGVITTGQSGNPASEHFRDQCELWGRGEYHPLPFSRAAVDAAAEHTMRLVPEDGDGSGAGG